jgi:outer membrane biogenesis lipoprotein LolB
MKKLHHTSKTIFLAPIAGILLSACSVVHSSHPALVQYDIDQQNRLAQELHSCKESAEFMKDYLRLRDQIRI